MVRAAMPEGSRHSRNGSLPDLSGVSGTGLAEGRAIIAPTVDDDAVQKMLDLLERANEVQFCTTVLRAFWSSKCVLCRYIHGSGLAIKDSSTDNANSIAISSVVALLSVTC